MIDFESAGWGFESLRVRHKQKGVSVRYPLQISTLSYSIQFVIKLLVSIAVNSLFFPPPLLCFLSI